MIDRRFPLIVCVGLRLRCVEVEVGHRNDNSVYSVSNDGELIINQVYTKLIQKSILQSLAFLNWTINHILNKHISSILQELMTFYKIEKRRPARGISSIIYSWTLFNWNVLSSYWLTIYSKPRLQRKWIFQTLLLVQDMKEYVYIPCDSCGKRIQMMMFAVSSYLILQLGKRKNISEQDRRSSII